jgi:formate hydrogenlyase transcriptional activator
MSTAQTSSRRLDDPTFRVQREQFTGQPHARTVDADASCPASTTDGSKIPSHVGADSPGIEQEGPVSASAIDLAERRRFELAREWGPDQRLGWFEQLLGELSASFINVPCHQLDASIGEAQQRIVEALDLDRCTLSVVEERDLVHCHEWTSPEFLSRAWFPPGARISASELFPWTLAKIQANELVQFSSVDEMPDVRDRESYRRFGTKSTVLVPLSVAGQPLGALAFATIRAERPWPPATVDRLQLVASAFAGMLARRHADGSLRAALVEVSRLKEKLQVEKVSLRREVPERTSTGLVVGESLALRRVEEQVRQVAPTSSTVLLLGETGSGKEMFATQIHELSDRHNHPMVRVNCAAIPATLIESELFGRERGAYTGALARQVGRFELADHSTIFLDEIGDLPLEVQVKLLRVLEERQFERLGSPRPIRVDTRIIAATHRDLEKLIAAGTFREDLYYRLCVFPIHVPPLRERADDIPLLVWRFVEEFATAFGKQIDSISPDDMAALQQYSWPGNIRELRNVVERAMIMETGRRLRVSAPAASSALAGRSVKLEDVEREHLRMVLESTGWRVRGVDGAARRLGLKPTTLDGRLSKLGLKRPEAAAR